ncbi:MAG: hypothetical protein LBK67_02745 [Coriobacteriales bacterium]|nr:hypothetical protein [Coriobacteriales bacterium]
MDCSPGEVVAAEDAHTADSGCEADAEREADGCAATSGCEADDEREADGGD